MKTADEFSPGDDVRATSYGDASGIGTDAEREDAVPGAPASEGMPPQDESAYDEDPAADAAVTGDVYAEGSGEPGADTP